MPFTAPPPPSASASASAVANSSPAPVPPPAMLPGPAPSSALATAAGEMECSIYQNYSASEVFVQGLAGLVNQQDVEAMIRAQKKMLQRFEKTNEMLSNCNTLSSTRLERALRDFKLHTALVMDIKKDVEIVLKRIRILKERLAAQNPDAFLKATGGAPLGATREEDDEYDEQIKLRKASSQGAKS